MKCFAPLTVALTLGVLTGCSAWASDPPGSETADAPSHSRAQRAAAPGRASDGPQEPKIAVPKGTAAEIWKFVEKSRSEAADARTEIGGGAAARLAVPRFYRAEVSIIKGADAVLRARPTEELAQKAALAKLQALADLSQTVGGRYKAQLAQFAQKVEEEYPDTQAAATAAIQGLMGRIRLKAEAAKGDVAKIGAAVESEVLGFVKKYPKSPAGPEVLAALGMQLEQIGAPASALKLYRTLMGKFPQSPLVERVAGSIRRLELPGKSIKLSGPSVAGGKVAVGDFKGKVLLVDFWATWCGPCIRALPEVKEAYAALHDRGFEILGVSLDSDKAKLKDFLEEQKIPWPQIFFADTAQQGWKNPIAEHFGVNAIPAMFLIGRDGKVVSTTLRGQEVKEAVEKLLDSKTGSKKAADDRG